MANIPDYNDPTIHESTIKVFRQKYYIVDDEEDTGRRTDYELREERIEISLDDDGAFIESKDGRATETLCIATPEMAKKVARHILETYGESVAPAPAPMELDESDFCEIKFLSPEVQARVGHELWELENHCTSPYGPVDANRAYKLLNHLEEIAKYLDIKPAPHPGT
jgi:hypothetical protein